MSKTQFPDDLASQVKNLEISFGDLTGLAASFDQELQKMTASFSAAGGGAARLEKTLSKGVGKAIDELVLNGGRLSDALSIIANDLINASWRAAVKPVAGHIGGLISGGLEGVFGDLLPFANGASFSQGRVMPFASGGIVSSATAFPMRGGVGVMGEAGPEAIMPLARGADGKLGVRAGAQNQSTQIIMNIQTPDVQGFQRSQSQIAAKMGQMLSLGARNR